MTQVVVVTGGAGGIGAPICRSLARDGLKVVVADFADEAGRSLAEEIGRQGGEALFQKVDVGDKPSVAGMVEKTLERWSRIDYLINGAGVLTRAAVLDMAEDEWDRVLRINLKGTFLCSQAVGRHMAERGSGRIICLASGRDRHRDVALGLDGGRMEKARGGPAADGRAHDQGRDRRPRPLPLVRPGPIHHRADVFPPHR